MSSENVLPAKSHNNNDLKSLMEQVSNTAKTVQDMAKESEAFTKSSKAELGAIRSHVKSAKTASDNATTHAGKAAAQASAAANSASVAEAEKGKALDSATRAKKHEDAAHEHASKAAESEVASGKSASEADASAKAAHESALNSAALEKSTHSYAEKAQTELAALEQLNKKAHVIINDAENALNLNTTRGLTEAFVKKARSAHLSMLLWSALLFISLGVVLYFGYTQFQEISPEIQKWAEEGKLLEVLGIKMFLLLSTVASPFWFAWFSTKKANHYFLLSEDYSRKATTATSYIGFKAQANELDPVFQERLFASVVTQLDESPLRFFEGTTGAASPLQDLLQQPFMRSALQDNPAFKASVTGWMNKFFKKGFYIPASAVVGGLTAGSEKDEVRTED